MVCRLNSAIGAPDKCAYDVTDAIGGKPAPTFDLIVMSSSAQRLEPGLPAMRPSQPRHTCAPTHSLRRLYAPPTPSLSFLYTTPDDNCPTRGSTPLNGETSMSVLDGVSLLLAVALFIYLLVALLRADRN